MVTDSVKALDESLTLDVLGLPFGTDRQGQVFDAGTNIGLQPGDAVPAFYWHGYAERDSGAVKSIGRAIYDRVDAAGHWFKVQLDSASEAARKIYEDAKAGMARASSDSSSHLVRPFGITGKPGYVSNWPIFALSLMDSTVADTAVNPRAVAMAAAKAIIEQSDADEEATAGEAVKAGAVFAMRNRERVKALKTLLDEMLAEMPVDAAPPEGDTAAKGEFITMNAEIEIENTDVTPASVNVEPKEPQAKGVDFEAVKADYDARLKALEDKLAESNRLKFASVNVNTNAAKADEDAAKAFNKAWDEYVRTGDAAVLRTPAAKAVMNRTTSGQGGYLPPVQYSNELITAINEASVLRAAGARVISLEGMNSFKVPTLTNSATAILQTESTSYDEVEPTVGEVTFTPYKFNRLSLATDELLEDSRIDVFGQILLPDAQNAFAQAENTYFATGTGTSQPQGIMVGGSVGVTAAGTNAITADEVIDLYHSLAPEYRNRATWVMKDSTLKAIRKFREGSGTGAYLWQPALSAGQPETILGRPVRVMSTVDALATGKKVIAFGDLSYFWIADFAYGNASFKRLEERYADLGQVGFRWSKRFDSRVMLSAAIKTLITA